MDEKNERMPKWVALLKKELIKQLKEQEKKNDGNEKERDASSRSY